MSFKSFANKGLTVGACKKACAKHEVDYAPEMVYMAGDPLQWGFDITEAGAPYILPASPVTQAEVEAAPVVEFADGSIAPNPFAGLMQTATPDALKGDAPKTTYKIQKDRPEQNGIKQPSVGTLCRSIWDALDKQAAETGKIPQIKPFRDALTGQGVDSTTCTIQFYRWRKFHGVTGRNVAE
jgi:hypothetical protein